MERVNEPSFEADRDEAALVARLRRGENAAYEELIRAYGGRLLAVARRFLPAASFLKRSSKLSWVGFL